MSPIGSRRAASLNRLHTELTTSLQGRAIVSVQNPVVLNDFSEPESDIALLKPRDDFYSQALPTVTDVLLIIEVADTSVEYDREIKLSAYARSGIAEVWLVDLPGDTVTTYSNAVNGVYRTMNSYNKQNNCITLLLFPDLSIPVAKILG